MTFVEPGWSIDDPTEDIGCWPGSLAHRMDGGTSGCGSCGWRGVPTSVAGLRSDLCPSCEQAALTGVVDATVMLELDARSKLGRNDPCWCGSGKKFKRCCGR